MEGKAKPSILYDSKTNITQSLDDLTDEEYKNFIKNIYEKGLSEIGYEVVKEQKKV